MAVCPTLPPDVKALAGNKVTHGLEVLVDQEGLEVLVDLLSWGSKGPCKSCEGLNGLVGLARNTRAQSRTLDSALVPDAV